MDPRLRLSFQHILKVRAYVQFKQPNTAGFERMGHWPADLFSEIAPPRTPGEWRASTR